MPRLHAVNAVVRRVAPNVAFYRRVGLDLPSAEGGYAAVQIGPDVRLCFLTERMGMPFRDHRSRGPGRAYIELSFRCDEPAEVDEVARQLEAVGADVRRAPFDAPWGARCCQVLDPEGNRVELFSPLP